MSKNYTTRLADYKPGFLEKILLFLLPKPFDIVKKVKEENGEEHLHLYLRRFCVFRFRKFGFFIHHIMRPDEDRDLHDHPWNYFIFILKGWYDEVRPTRSARTFKEKAENLICTRRQTWTMRTGKAENLHRISKVSPGGVWTLFFRGLRRRHWGFNEDGTWMHWQDYLTKNCPESIVADKNFKPSDPESFLKGQEVY